MLNSPMTFRDSLRSLTIKKDNDFRALDLDFLSSPHVCSNVEDVVILGNFLLGFLSVLFRLDNIFYITFSFIWKS